MASSGLDLYVLDWATLWRVPANGKATVLASDLTGARGIAVDASGTVYVADTLRNRIVKVTAQGVVTTLAGSGSPGLADGSAKDTSFDGPAGIAVDREGRVYVADTGNNTIRRISPTVSSRRSPDPGPPEEQTASARAHRSRDPAGSR